MYGSQYQSEAALTLVRANTQALIGKTHSKRFNRISALILVIGLAFTFSSLTFAGSSQPQLKGKNGNASGR